jgi:hypothetical protein
MGSPPFYRGKDMYIYRCGYGSCEESDYAILSHEKKFTNSQIHEMIKAICVDLYQQFHTSSDREDSTGAVWSSFESRYDHCTFQDLWSGHGFPDDTRYNIPDELIKRYGFKRVKFEADIGYFGWASVDKDDWVSHVNEGTEDLRKRVIEVYGENTSERY